MLSSSSVPKSSSPRLNSAHGSTSSRPRHNSIAPVQEQVQQQSASKPPIQPQGIRYTAIVRLPFSRPEGFIDPPRVEWDASKDKTLWKLISKASNSRDLDWEGMAERFGVGLGFLLMQAAWLYERHFEGMKMQMLRLGGGIGSGAASPTVGGASGDGNGSGSASGVVRTSSRKGEFGRFFLRTTIARPREDDILSKILLDPKAIPALLTTIKKDAALPPGDHGGSSPGTPRTAQPPISRTPSTTTVTQSRLMNMTGQSQQQSQQRYSRGSSGTSRRPPAPSRPSDSLEDDSESALGHDDSDSDESEDAPSLLRSQAFRRPAVAKKAIPRLGTLNSDADAEDEEDEDDSSGGYLPFAGAVPTGNPHNNALRGQPHQHGSYDQQKRPMTGSNLAKPTRPAAPVTEPTPGTETSSAASSSLTFSSPRENPASSPMHRGPLSPRRRTELTPISPRNPGSEDSPSMGSSFSDLDVDASVTQSALEDALLSHMQRGGSVVSRVGSLGSTIGQGMERFRRG
nr:autophagy-related protein 29 [Quercus suber]